MLNRQIICILKGTNCVADLFLFCFEKNFMIALSDDDIDFKQNFKPMVHRIYPAELQLNKANASDRGKLKPPVAC